MNDSVIHLRAGEEQEEQTSMFTMQVTCND